ncbi:MAG: hypothetical protein KatS3mg105_2025 [Gemmatales bacterium]|nr:MAG: hypothetical protein KatS3mg105_2025 [Gemmatales bacterium]
MSEEAAPRQTNPMLVAVALAATLVALVFAVKQLATPGVLPVDDFCEYWAAGRLNAAGRNPYDPDLLFPIQKQVGWHADKAVMMWNPPWTLTIAMPLGLLDYHVARVLWLLLNIGLILMSADRLWFLYGGDPKLRWISWVAAVSYLPTAIVLRNGQIPPLMLAALTGFLYLHERRPFYAGALLVFAAVKPHHLYLLWAGLLLWSVQRRRFGVLFGGATAALVATAIPCYFNPAVIEQYRIAMATYPPFDWVTTTFGTVLRFCLHFLRNDLWNHVWLQFLPSIIGLIWFIPYWWRRRAAWDWTEQMPLVLVVSFMTSSYGWLEDQVVLLIALIPMAVWIFCLRREYLTPALWCYGILSAIVLVIRFSFRLQYGLQEMFYIWCAPALLFGYLFLKARIADHANRASD